MKKLQVFFLAVIVLVLMSGQLYAQFEGSAALFVVAGTGDTATTAENAIVSRLEGMGFDVMVEFQDLVTDDSIEDMALLLISATVTSSTVAGNMPGIADYEIPVINWEPFIYDTQGFQDVDEGEFNTTEIEILDEEHPMAAGLEGIVTIANSEKAVSYGLPQGDVQVVAANIENSDQVVLFGYEEGAAMLVGTAPARRVGHFLLNDVADDMTEDGWALFDASVYWAMNYVPVSVKDVNPNAPASYVLHDNYPNPFNPITHIVFSIPKQTHVRLSIWNALGEKMATLVDEIRPAGNHPVTFNASDMASGLYFYKLEAGSQTVTKKMLLMK